jgi:guanine deaminase
VSAKKTTGDRGKTAALTGLRGIVLSPAGDGALVFHRDGAVAWDASGRITFVGDWKQRPAAVKRWQDFSGQVITPGFIDVHSHLPQYPMVGRGGHSLLPWLQQFIFPVEKNFTARAARVQAPRYFQALKENGITAAAIFTAVYEVSTDLCFEAAATSGLRVTMGKMMMDVNSYTDLEPRKILAQTLAESERLCAKWHGREAGRLRYAFSPRFAVTCSQKLMTEVGKMARAADAFVQTHLSENTEELELVRGRFPWAKDYTEVYEKCELLGPKTIVGHAIHLSAREYRALALTDTKVAHCPSSNLFLGSGVMAWEKMKLWNIAVGLGNDVAAGPELSPWEVMKAGLYAQSARKSFRKETEVPSPTELFQAATWGGAKVLGLESGSLQVGKPADVVVWDGGRVGPYEEKLAHWDNGAELLSQMIYRGSQARVEKLFVQGQTVLK